MATAHQNMDFPDPDGFRYLPGFLTEQQADDCFAQLHEAVDWQQDQLKLFGKRHKIPRLHQWYGDCDATYRWSGLEMHPRSWIEPLPWLRARLSDYCRSEFNSVLLNLYRDGSDSMGWHADDEPELGPNPTIVCISLGAERDLQLRRKDRSAETQSLCLEHGSLLVMSGSSQRYWQHALPKRKRVLEPRISLTYRQVIGAAAAR